MKLNQDQVLSFTRTVLKLAAGGLLTHGLTKAGNFLNAEDVVGIVLAIVGALWSHYTHSEDPAEASTPAAGNSRPQITRLAGQNDLPPATRAASDPNKPNQSK